MKSLVAVLVYAGALAAMCVGFDTGNTLVGFASIAVMMLAVAGWFSGHRHYYEKRDRSLVPAEIQEAIRNKGYAGGPALSCGQCIRCNRWFQQSEVYHEAGETRIYWYDLEKRRDRDRRHAMKKRRRRDRYAAEGGHLPLEDLRESRDAVTS